MEDITDSDYNHAKRVCKAFEKKLCEYHILYFKSDTLLMGHVYEHFRKMGLKIDQLDSPKFVSVPGLS